MKTLNALISPCIDSLPFIKSLEESSLVAHSFAEQEECENRTTSLIDKSAAKMNKKIWNLSSLNKCQESSSDLVSTLKVLQASSTSKPVSTLSSPLLGTASQSSNISVLKDPLATSLQKRQDDSRCSQLTKDHSADSLDTDMQMIETKIDSSSTVTDSNSSELDKLPVDGLNFDNLSKLNAVLTAKTIQLSKHIINCIRFSLKSSNPKEVSLSIKVLFSIGHVNGLMKELASHKDEKVILTLLQESYKYNLKIMKISGQALSANSEKQVKETKFEMLKFIPILFELAINKSPAIRINAQLLLFLISQKEILIQEKLFYILCDDVNFGDVRVRVNACRLMGRFKNIHTSILMQTLSKKEVLESNRLRVLETGDYEMPSEFNITNSSMCGAFIHALEDEFARVRSVAISNYATYFNYKVLFAS